MNRYLWASKKAELTGKYLNMSESTYLQNLNMSVSKYVRVHLKDDCKLIKM